MIDPPYQYDQTLAKFQAKYSNRALVVSLEPIEIPTPGPDWIMASAVVGISGLVCFSLVLMRYKAARRSLVPLLCLTAGLQGCGARQAEQLARQGSEIRDLKPQSGLTIESIEHHAGKILQIDPDQKIERTTEIHNDTKAPLRIVELRKSCACTSVTLDRSTIPSGEKAIMKATFRLGSRPGPNRVGVEIDTSYPGDQGTQLVYDWDLVTPLFAEPAESRLGRLEPGQTVSAEVALRNRGLVLCRECRVEVHAENLLSASFTADPSLARCDDPTHTGTGLSPESRLGSVVLKATSKADPGDFAESAEILLRCRGIDRARLSIPVSWSIRSAFEVLPARLWLGSTAPGGRIDHRAFVRSNDETPLRVVRVAGRAAPLEVKSHSSAEAEIEKAIDLEIVAPARKGFHRGVLEIVIEGKGETRVRLPISVVVGGTTVGSGAESQVGSMETHREDHQKPKS